MHEIRDVGHWEVGEVENIEIWGYGKFWVRDIRYVECWAIWFITVLGQWGRGKSGE